MKGPNPPDQSAVVFEASELAKRLRLGDLPVVKARGPLPPGDQCHFAAPVRFGRRRADQYGHLVLTSGWLKFRGTLDVSVTWSEVENVCRVGREIVISLQERCRQLRFLCHADLEAVRGSAIAQHLVQSVAAHTAESSAPFDHAAL